MKEKNQTIFHKLLSFILLTSMQSKTLHIASSLFFIFHKAFSRSKYVDQIRLPYRGSFVRDEK